MIWDRIFCEGEEKDENIFAEEKKTEKEKEEDIWRRKIFFGGGEEKREGKGGKYLEDEKTFKWRRRNTEKEKEENIMVKEKLARDVTGIKGSKRCPRGPKKTYFCPFL